MELGSIRKSRIHTGRRIGFLQELIQSRDSNMKYKEKINEQVLNENYAIDWKCKSVIR